MTGCRRLLRRHEAKAPPRNDGEKSHCEAMSLYFMAVAIAVMVLEDKSVLVNTSPETLKRLLRHSTSFRSCNDWLKKRLLRRREAKAPTRNDREKSHCEAMSLPFMAVAIAVMVLEDKSVLLNTSPETLKRLLRHSTSFRSSQ